MSDTAFPVNDLLRKKMQTSLAILSLASCVASTVFLLLFAERTGLGISSLVEGKLTAGFSLLFYPFLTLLMVLVVISGVVMISFTAFIMMAQRTRDVGLMKAAGCPNGLVFGYFFTELLVVAFVACVLGTLLGVVAEIACSDLLGSFGSNPFHTSIGIWTPVAAFVSFFVLTLALGVSPVVRASQAEPAKALSPAHYLGLEKEPGFTVLSRSSLSLKMAVRTLVRHRSATVRIVFCLSLVFLLVTVAVAGGLIAQDTSKSWVEDAIGRNVLLVGQREMVAQYQLLCSEFYEGASNTEFNYTNPKYQLTKSLLGNLSSITGVAGLDTRLVVEEQVMEIQGYIYGSTTLGMQSVGDHREGASIVVGVDATDVVSDWSINGQFLQEGQTDQAVVGDSLSRALFSEPLNQKIGIHGRNLNITGVCLDPLNNGNVTYVSLSFLEDVTGDTGPNIALVKLDPSANKTEIFGRISALLQNGNSNLQVYDLDVQLSKSLDFVGSLWSPIMLLPVFSLLAASLSLVGYVALSINEQRQEFGIIRALGAKPRAVLKIVLTQSLIIVLASYALGTALGIILTLLILVQEPLVTTFTVVEIACWLLVGLAVTFAASAYPATIFAKKPLLETITKS